jgi:hypothetical protein
MIMTGVWIQCDLGSHYALGAPWKVASLDAAVDVYRASANMPFVRDVTVIVWLDEPDGFTYPDYIIEANLDGEPYAIRT